VDRLAGERTHQQAAGRCRPTPASSRDAAAGAPPGASSRARRRSGRAARLFPLGLVLFAAVALGACQKTPDDAAVAIRGWHLTADQVAAEYTRINGAGAYDTASVATRESFARTLADREILLRLARKEVPELTGLYARQLRVLREKYLQREYLKYRRDRFKLPAEVEAQRLPRLTRQAIVRQIAIQDPTLKEPAAAALKAGTSFEQLAAQFGSVPRPAMNPAMAGRPPANAPKWRERTIRVDDPRCPPKLMVDVLLADLSAGDIVGPTETREGNLLVELVRYEPIEQASDTTWMRRARGALEMLGYMDSHAGWRDSLVKATGFSFQRENIPLIQERFDAYWDSIDGLTRQGINFDVRGIRVPYWRYTAEELAKPLYVLNGQRTIEDYLRSLEEIDADYWPTRGSVDKIAAQVEGRLERLLLFQEAEKSPVKDSPEFQAMLTPQRDKYVLEQYYEIVTRDVAAPGKAEIEAKFQEVAQYLRTPDLISFSALVYPRDQEARARAAVQKLRQGDPLLWLEFAPSQAAADTNIRYIPPTELLDAAKPAPRPEWSDLFRLARGMQEGEISDAVPAATAGGYGVVRVVDRQPPRAMTLQEATPELEKLLRQNAKDGVIEQTLVAQRKKMGVQVFPDRLQSSAAEPAPGTTTS